MAFRKEGSHNLLQELVGAYANTPVAIYCLESSRIVASLLPEWLFCLLDAIVG